MTTHSDVVENYRAALNELRASGCELEDLAHTISHTAATLHHWSRENPHALIDSVPLQWPDSLRLVEALARQERARVAARKAWQAVPPWLQPRLPGPDQFLASLAEATSHC